MIISIITDLNFNQLHHFGAHQAAAALMATTKSKEMFFFLLLFFFFFFCLCHASKMNGTLATTKRIDLHISSSRSSRWPVRPSVCLFACLLVYQFDQFNFSLNTHTNWKANFTQLNIISVSRRWLLSIKSVKM